MSISNLLTNYMTIETSEGANQTADGSIDRAGAWTPIPQFTNILCHLQEKSRPTINFGLGILEEQHTNIIYHNNLALYNYCPNSGKNQTGLRVIINRSNPCNTLSFPVKLEDILIYSFLGHIEQVAGLRKKYKFFVLRVEQTSRWNR